MSDLVLVIYLIWWCLCSFLIGWSFKGIYDAKRYNKLIKELRDETKATYAQIEAKWDALTALVHDAVSIISTTEQKQDLTRPEEPIDHSI